MTLVPARQRLPRRREGITYSVEIAGAEVYITANRHADGRLGELFCKWGKEGSTGGGLMDSLSIMVSLGLQHGVPLKIIVSKLKDMRYEPMGMTDDPDVPQVSSPSDYVARRLALDFLTPEERNELGIYSVDEEARGLTAAEPVAVSR